MIAPTSKELTQIAQTSSVPAGWTVHEGEEWRRVIDNQIQLRVGQYRAVYFVTASDGVESAHPTAVFSQSGCKTLHEAMRTAEVLGDALRTTLAALAKSTGPSRR